MKLEDIPYQYHAKRAAEIALAGNHSILFIGNKDAIKLSHWVFIHGGNSTMAFPCPCGNLGSLIECDCTDKTVIEWGKKLKSLIKNSFDMVINVVDETPERCNEWNEFEKYEIEGIVLGRINVCKYKTGQYIGSDICDLLYSAYRKSENYRPKIDVIAIAVTIQKMSRDRFYPYHLAEAIQYQPCLDMSE